MAYISFALITNRGQRTRNSRALTGTDQDGAHLLMELNSTWKPNDFRLHRAITRCREITPVEKNLLHEIASHDPTKFAPSIGILADALYGDTQKKQKELIRR